jgi:hypothetical protein
MDGHSEWRATCQGSRSWIRCPGDYGQQHGSPAEHWKIQVEFAGRGKKNETVRRRWKEYLDNLADLSQDPKKQEEQLPGWSRRNEDLLAELLHDMGAAVGYDFDKVQIRRGIYAPRGHANLELEAQLIRRFLIQLLAGERALPLDVRSLPPVAAPEDAQPPEQLKDAKLPQ